MQLHPWHGMRARMRLAPLAALVLPRQTHGCTGLTIVLAFDTRGLFSLDGMGISARGAMSMI